MFQVHTIRCIPSTQKVLEWWLVQTEGPCLVRAINVRTVYHVCSSDTFMTFTD